MHRKSPATARRAHAWRAILAACLTSGLAGCVVQEGGRPPGRPPYQQGGAQILSGGGECLDVQRGNVQAGTPLILFRCHGSPNQSWTLQNNQIITTTGSCVDVIGAVPVDGAPVIIAACSGAPSQRWSLANGQIVNGGGKCMDTLFGGTGDRTPVILSTCGSAPTQQWSVQ